MAEIAEGFTISAIITLNTYDGLNVLGEIKLPTTKITEDTIERTASLILEDSAPSAYLGDILRTNFGTQGFTIKASCSANTIDNNDCVGDIKCARCIISDQTGDCNASVLLDSIDTANYIGDILRANSGNQGFTVKALTTLNTMNAEDIIADINHGKVHIEDISEDIRATLIIDRPYADFKDYLGDIVRENFGKQGFTVKAFSSVSTYGKHEVLGDVFRSMGGKLLPDIGVFAYKGKYYFMYTNEKIHDMMFKEKENKKDESEGDTTE